MRRLRVFALNQKDARAGRSSACASRAVAGVGGEPAAAPKPAPPPGWAPPTAAAPKPKPTGPPPGWRIFVERPRLVF